jgi:hypothetical protein
MILSVEINQAELKKTQEQINKNIEKLLEMANESDLFVPVNEIFSGTCLELAYKDDRGFILWKGEG